jgi:hypothetical protein
MHSQAKGTHKATDVFGSLAGSKTNRNRSRISQINKAKVGDITFYV